MASAYSEDQWARWIREAQDHIGSLASEPSQSTVEIIPQPISRYIDHTLLQPDATSEQIRQLCQQAIEEKFATVCVRLDYVQEAACAVKGTGVGVACVVGFHEGTQPTTDKVEEAIAAIAAGATELDVVLNRELLQSGRHAAVYQELRELRGCAPKPLQLKLILETSQLSPDDIIAASVIAGHAEFDFVKTSTGFCGRGASVDDVRLMNHCREYLNMRGVGPPADDENQRPKVQIKASGGIRSYMDALTMIHFGASRLGTSSGMKIAKEAKQRATGSKLEATERNESDGDRY